MFFVYRDHKTMKIAQGDQQIGEELDRKFGAFNMGTAPYDNEEQAEQYRQKCQAKVDLDPTCKLPYSIDKD